MIHTPIPLGNSQRTNICGWTFDAAAKCASPNAYGMIYGISSECKAEIGPIGDGSDRPTNFSICHLLLMLSQLLDQESTVGHFGHQNVALFDSPSLLCWSRFPVWTLCLIWRYRIPFSFVLTLTVAFASLTFQQRYVAIPHREAPCPTGSLTPQHRSLEEKLNTYALVLSCALKLLVLP
jgi:hypothetical protein